MEVKVIPEPDLESIIQVEQRSFGVLTIDVNATYIETIGIGPCLGIYLDAGNSKVLAHLDPLNVTNGDVDHIFQYFQQKWIDFNPTRAILIASAQTPADNIAKGRKYLESKGISTDIDNSSLNDVSVIIDKAGNYAHLSDIKARKSDTSVTEAQDRSFEQSMKRDKLYRLECATDRGWARLERLPTYEGQHSDRQFIGEKMFAGLPFSIIIDNGIYYQNVDFEYSPEMMQEIKATMSAPQGTQHFSTYSSGRYKGDYIVRKLTPTETNRVTLIIGAK